MVGLVAKSCPTLETPWTVACQAPLSMGFSRQEYWSGLPFPSPGDLSHPGIESRSLTLQADSLLTELWGKPRSGIAGSKDKCTCISVAAAAKSLQSCPTLCDPIDGSPPGSPVPGILQARTLEWVASSFSMKVKSESEVAQSCPTLRDPVDFSLPGSSVHGIFQAGVLEWGAIA